MQDSNHSVDTGHSTDNAAVPAAEAEFGLGRQRKHDPLKWQEAVVAMGRRAIAPPEPAILMQDAAALLAEILDTEASAIAELSPDGRKLRMRLALGEGSSATTPGTTHESSSAGTDSLAGYALQVAHPVAVANLAEDKRFVEVFLRRHGIRSALAVPLKLRERSFGTLIACSKKDCRFDDEDVLFAETIAHLVTTTVARRETEDSLAEERRLASEVLQTVDALVVVLDPQWQIVRINAACERVTGFSLDEVRGRPIWNVFPVPEEVGMFANLLEQLKTSSSPVGYESYLLTKHSQRRRISWSFLAMCGADGKPHLIIATGVDITEQREAEQRAQQAEEAAEEARHTVASLMAAGDDHAQAARGSPTTGQEAAVSTFGRMPIPRNAERRKQPRRSYPYWQKVGVVVDGRLPDRNSFVEVLCNDIAAGGFSFLTARPPESDMVVVALGIPPKITHLIAQVCHITRTERDGEGVFLVGCHYVGRAAY